jgi:hypothetical protein
MKTTSSFAAHRSLVLLAQMLDQLERNGQWVELAGSRCHRYRQARHHAGLAA